MSNGHELIGQQKIGDSFSGTYYVESVFIKKTVQKKDYSDFVLKDKSGSRSVKFWGVVDGISKGDFVFVAANVEEYHGAPSIVAKNVEKADAPADLSDYTPVCENAEQNAEKYDTLHDILKELATEAGDETAILIVDEVYENSTFFGKFVSAPGSDKSHYGVVGGLLANTVRLAEKAYEDGKMYGLSPYELMLVISSALLSRIGGIDAYTFVDCSAQETKMGALLGMNNLTMTRVSSALKRVVAKLKKDKKRPSQDTVVRLLHAVSSYQGNGVIPMTKEAMALNSAYRLDNEMVHASDFVENDMNDSEDFTAYDPILRRRFYTGS